MTWEWSHTKEAEEAVHQNIFHQSREWLEVVYAEWEARDLDDPNNLLEFEYEKAREKAKTLHSDILADYIWDKVSRMRLCTNGGWQAHCCSFGCDCHMVSFDKETEDVQTDSD